MRYNLKVDIPSNIRRFSKSYVTDFLNYLVKTNRIKTITLNRLDIATDAVGVFMFNCYKSVLVDKNRIVIPMDKNVYSAGYIKNGRKSKKKVSYRYTKWFIEYLVEINLGGFEVGGIEWETYVYRNHRRYKEVDRTCSVFYIYDTLYNKMSSLRQNIGFIVQDSVIFLRNSEGVDQSFKMDEYRKCMRDLLNKYNKHSLEVKVSKAGANTDYRIQLRKIYNESFNKGGKMYDLNVQNMTKSERRKLTINGAETVIYDFTAFETSLVYSLCQEVITGDPYQTFIEGYDAKLLREVGKMVMTRIYYTKDEKQLRDSVNYDISKDFNLDRLLQQGKIPEKRIPVGQIIEMLKNKHEVISEYFFGKGDNDPANVGSLVMDYITEYMLQNHSALVIPVFDEVICEDRYDFEIQQIMRKAYKHVVGFDDNCVIKKEK